MGFFSVKMKYFIRVLGQNVSKMGTWRIKWNTEDISLRAFIGPSHPRCHSLGLLWCKTERVGRGGSVKYHTAENPHQEELRAPPSRKLWNINKRDLPQILTHSSGRFIIQYYWVPPSKTSSYEFHLIYSDSRVSHLRHSLTRQMETLSRRVLPSF